MMQADKKSEDIDHRQTGAGKPASPKRVKSETLMGERKELIIEHAGREYVLRITQNGKLILTA